MNKNLIAIAVAGVLSAPMAAQAADSMDAKVSGFVDTFLTFTNDNDGTNTGIGAGSMCDNGTTNACETQFDVAESEIDVEAMGVRIDVDHKSASGNSLEQANFTVDMSGWALTAGLFNSNLTVDGQDAPDMMFSTPSLVALNYGMAGGIAGADLTNVAGAQISGMAGPATLRLAVINDPTINLATDDAANAFIVGASGSVMDGLDLAVNMTSTDADDLTDVQVNYTLDALRINLDYMTSDYTDVYSVMAGYDLGNGMGVKVRIDNDDNGTEVTDTTTVHFDYAMTDNVALALENYSVSSDAAGANDWSATTLEFIATF